MSRQSIEIILNRIKSAEPHSPLAVFDDQMKENMDCVFANTVKTQRQIRNGRNLVGIFHNETKNPRLLLLK